MFERIKKWYTLGLWTEKMVKEAAEKGLLTEAEVQTVLEVVLK